MRFPISSVCHAGRAGLSTSPDVEPAPAGPFLLQFQSLFHAGREFAFPCDENGQVNLDAMSTWTRNNYLYARAMLGREFAWPRVCTLQQGHTVQSVASMQKT